MFCSRVGRWYNNYVHAEHTHIIKYLINIHKAANIQKIAWAELNGLPYILYYVTVKMSSLAGLRLFAI